MGIAVLSGVIASLDSTAAPSPPQAKWESHTPGTLTPNGHSMDESLPERFIACVSREESAKKLRTIFFNLGPRGASVEILAGENVRAVKQADVVLLW